MSLELGIVAPVSAMGGALLMLAVMRAADHASKVAEAQISASGKSRSTAGTTDVDHLHETQVKELCHGCDETVSKAEKRKCGNCPAEVGS